MDVILKRIKIDIFFIIYKGRDIIVGVLGKIS